MKTNAQRAREYRINKKLSREKRVQAYLTEENHEKLLLACKWESKTISEILNMLIKTKLKANNWKYRDANKIKVFFKKRF